MRASIKALTVLAAVLCAFSAQAMTVCPYINGAYFWNDGGTMKLKQGVDFAIEIQMDNPEPFARTVISTPLAFYGLGGVDNWTLVDKGGDLVPNIVTMNGFQFYPQPNPWFGLGDSIWLVSWDGVMGDSMWFWASGYPGMPPGEPLLTRLQFWFRIDDSGTFCVDSVYVPNVPGDKYTWFFDNPSPAFYGPHCWEVGEPATYLCGDANYDQAISIFDVTYLINTLYRDGMQPFPNAAGDNNADGQINILDVSNLVNYLYRNGPPPVCR